LNIISGIAFLFTVVVLYLYLMSDCQTYLRSKKMRTNHLKEIRESFLLGKSELARKANISVETLSRIEHGKPCRIGTKRKFFNKKINANLSKSIAPVSDSGRGFISKICSERVTSAR
jgi:DNA-binding XRE family transcriptional regulator